MLERTVSREDQATKLRGGGSPPGWKPSPRGLPSVRGSGHLKSTAVRAVWACCKRPACAMLSLSAQSAPGDLIFRQGTQSACHLVRAVRAPRGRRMPWCRTRRTFSGRPCVLRPVACRRSLPTPQRERALAWARAQQGRRLQRHAGGCAHPVCARSRACCPGGRPAL